MLSFGRHPIAFVNDDADSLADQLSHFVDVESHATECVGSTRFDRYGWRVVTSEIEVDVSRVTSVPAILRGSTFGVRWEAILAGDFDRDDFIEREAIVADRDFVTYQIAEIDD